MPLNKTATKAGVFPWYDVFCQSGACSMWTEGGATRKEAALNAAAAGWTFNCSQGWVCSVCAKKMGVKT